MRAGCSRRRSTSPGPPSRPGIPPPLARPSCDEMSPADPDAGAPAAAGATPRPAAGPAARHTRSEAAVRSPPAPRPVPERRRIPLPAALAGCTVLLLLTMTLGVAIGSVPPRPAAIWGVIADHLAGHPHDSVADAIVWEIRLPRVLLAAVVGAALTTAGTVVQVLVRNSLADPFLLGVSSGASVGATAVLLFGALASLGAWAISIGSVLGALGAMAAVFLVSRQRRALAPTQLILCGVVLSALFESVTSFLIFRGNPQATQSVLFWL